MRSSFKNRRGIGGIGLLGILAALLLVIVIYMTMLAEPDKKATGVSVKEKMESMGAKLPENTTISNAPEIGRKSASEIEQTTNLTTSSLKCKVDGAAKDPDCAKK